MQEESKHQQTYRSVPVTFKCGHSETVVLFGDEDDVSLQARGMSKKCECPYCAIKHFGDWPYLSYENALEEARKLEFPLFSGKFEDVKRATLIRSHLLHMPVMLLRYLFVQESYALGEYSRFHDIIKDCFWEDEYPISCLEQVLHDELAKITQTEWWLREEAHCAREIASVGLRWILETAFQQVQELYQLARQYNPTASGYQLDQMVGNVLWNRMTPEERYKTQNSSMSNRKHVKSAKDRKRKK